MAIDIFLPWLNGTFILKYQGSKLWRTQMEKNITEKYIR
jgi:hypothetical protein